MNELTATPLAAMLCAIGEDVIGQGQASQKHGESVSEASIPNKLGVIVGTGGLEFTFPLTAILQWEM